MSADRHTWNGTATAQETALMQEKMRLFISPNTPVTEEQQTAFEQAVAWQIAHEKSIETQTGDIPDGVSSFRIGDFSMTFTDGANSAGLTRKTICPAAYSLLLRQGLLYRGLEGRCCL